MSEINPLSPGRIRAVALALLILAANRAYAQDYRVVKEEANVRADSTVTSASLGYLGKNQVVRAVGEKYDWYRIILPENFTCYAAARFLTKNTGSNRVTVSAGSLRLRDRPSLDSNIIGVVKQGTTLTVAGETKDWLKIKGCPHARGWVHKNFLKKVESPAQKETAAVKTEKSGTQSDLLLDLREAGKEKKKEICARLIATGKPVLPQMESYLSGAGRAKDKSVFYNIIYIMAGIGKNNPELARYFLSKITAESLMVSAAYLDIVQDIVKPQTRKPYFYLAQNNGLGTADIETAKKSLQRLCPAIPQ